MAEPDFNYFDQAAGTPAKSTQRANAPMAWLTAQFKPRIKSSQITRLLRQLGSLTKAGIPMAHALEVLIASSTHQQLKSLLERIRQSVNSGQSLAATLGTEPQHFSPLTCALIDIGEQSGILTETLERLALEQEKQEKLKRQLKAVLTYPVAVILVALVITAILLIKVVPEFEAMFQGFGAELPAVTQAVMTLSVFAQSYWLPILVALFAGFVGGRALYRHHRPTRLGADRILLALPLFGALVEKSLLAGLCQTLATTINANAPLIKTLQTISTSISNQVYADALSKTAIDVDNGEGLAEALQKRNIFPILLIQMINIGEEAGQIASMLDKVCNYYENEVERSIAVLSRLLEPVIMCILGILIGGLILAMYLPIFNLGNVLSGGY